MNLLKYLIIALIVVASGGGQARAHFLTTVQRQTQNAFLNFDFFQPPSGAKLSYYGGPIISNVHVYSVEWGSQVNAQVKTDMPIFYQAMVESNYMDWLAEYNTWGVAPMGGKGGTSQTIGRGKYIGEIMIQPNNTATTIKDSEIRIEIESQVVAGNLPIPDENTLFMFNMPPGTTILYDTLAVNGIAPVSCKDFCAYHSNYRRSDKKAVYYGVIPDYFQGPCHLGCGSSDAFGNYTSAASHEVIESVTDPLSDEPPVGSADFPMAWYWNDGKGGQEIGDICTGNSPDGFVTGNNLMKYIVQGEWSNSHNNCYPGPNAN